MNTRTYLEGESSKGYNFFGSHKRKEGGYIFRILAPQAKNVYLAGDFNNWEKENARKYSTGVFSIKSDNAKLGDRYCYYIEDKDSKLIKKIDPYGLKIDPSLSFSVIADREYKFKNRKVKSENLNIFQVDLKSYFNSLNENINLGEEGEKLIKYLKDNNFNHIELLPIVQSRLSESLGFRPINLISIDNRIITVKAFKEFVDLCHKNKIGVILNFDFSEFDDFKEGLVDFDGSRMFERDCDDIRYNYFSGMNFDYSKNIVKSYILSSLEFWAKEYNIDIIKFANLEKLIYWQGDLLRGVNKQSYDFIKILNQKIHDLKIKSIGSSTTNKEIIGDDLGFDNIEDRSIRDVVKIFQKEAFYRNSYKNTMAALIGKDLKEKIIGMNYVDSTIEGCSPTMKMNGEDYKYEQYKTLMTLIYTLKSHKIIFSGQEIGDLKKWEVGLTKKDKLNSSEEDFQLFFRNLTFLCTKTKAFSHDESQLIPLDIEGYSVYAYKRIYKNDEYLILINQSDMDYSIDLIKPYSTLLDSQGNYGKTDEVIVKANLKKFSALILKKK